MSFTNAEGRERILAELADAIGRLADALASLGEAYEQLDDHTADVLESELFKPVQQAYGHALKAHHDFAVRHGLAGTQFDPGSSGMHSSAPRSYVERAIEAAGLADQLIAELQDSMLPVEVGDRELREALAHTRELISSVPARGRQLLRTLGR